MSPDKHIIINTLRDNITPSLHHFLSHTMKPISTHRMQFSNHHGLRQFSGVCGVTHVLEALRGVSSGLLS